MEENIFNVKCYKDRELYTKATFDCLKNEIRQV